MLNRDFDCLTVNGICDLTSEKKIIAGSPLTLGANGYKLAKAGDQFVGLSFNYFHTGKNDVTGGEWFADSGKLGVVKIAQVTLEADEIDGEKVYPFVYNDPFTVGAKVYVNADGLLTVNAPALDGYAEAEAVATVVSYDGDKGILKLFVNAQN